MGIDVARFSGDIDEDLLCPICSNVLEDPLQAPTCEHAFCNSCITEWLTRNQTCPIDRRYLTIDALKPVPRILRNLLSRLSLMCDNEKHGCPAVVKLEALQTHLLECEFNPKRPVPCSLGCGITIPFDELKDHNCVRSLRIELVNMETKVATLQTENAETKSKISEQMRQIQVLKDLVRSICGNNPAIRALTDQMEADEVVRWSNSLSRARVTRWGGMISTPDAHLQIFPNLLEEKFYLLR
ncbi:hypothetical protein QYM36_014355 [Artemia franciscana]|uniref:E3 ubiquitin-protein ligase NRDP1 n=1 Tax=Artemia franciscana TaxID=6661 RepID=A0AA88HN41_ARTSF|nr:hypothetical protein QYM36_014355 [Artemia franciscana]